MSPIGTWKPVYLDHNATTPCAPEVVAAMLPYFANEFGNPSSGHLMGRRAANAVEQARSVVAAAIGASARDIYFTSGATESNNIVLFGLAHGDVGRHRIVLAVSEHKSVLEPVKRLSTQGFEIVKLPLTRDGIVNLEYAKDAIDNTTLLVSIHGANSELGTLQPVGDIAQLAHAHGALVHCDAAQMLGKVPLALNELQVDFASCSGHKIYGPKGIGVLFAKSGSARKSIVTVYRGGTQERRLRPGTLNVPAIVGLAEACRLVSRRLQADMANVAHLRDTFERALYHALPDAYVNGKAGDRLPGTSNITIPGATATMLMANVPQICISEGSACNSGAMEPSHVLLAIGLSRDEAESTIRVSFGRGNSVEDAGQAAREIAAAAMLVRSTPDGRATMIS